MRTPCPPHLSTTRTCLLLLACVGATWLAGLGGCSNRQEACVAPDMSLTEGTWPAVAPRVSVSNFNGRIDLIVDERLKEPSVEAVTWAVDRDANVSDPEVTSQLSITSGLEESADGSRVFRVVATGREGLRADVGVNLAIRVPSAGAINVYNRGGPVMIKGATNAVQVENGRGPQGENSYESWDAESDDAWIQLKTTAPIDDPIALVTDSGDVAIVLGPGARGVFDIQAPNGAASARAHVGTFDRFKGTGHSISARYNGGTNPVLLQTERGDATAIMTENSETFMFRMW